ncbi:hypothetical protein HPB52_022125 [Rhipicephalus sanguineus]|uniref:Uncharacterized protein n=1 Tax=Rhipicephalus sanguineus TaxID=34632 RepID=A0A9D4SR40_RHISA|nr:hypothetical protein HPB52_022125 [Rhipicephalus sanguineus]
MSRTRPGPIRSEEPPGVSVVCKSIDGCCPKGEGGLFYTGFRYIGLYNKTIGACFLGGLESSDWSKVYSLQRSWFTVFTLLCLFGSLVCGFSAVVEYELCSRQLSEANRFHAAAYASYVSCVIIESVVNYTMSLVRAPRLRGLIIKCSELEMCLRTPPGSKRRTKLYAVSVMTFYAVQIALCMSLAVATDCGASMLQDKASPLMKIYSRGLGTWYILVLVPQCLGPRLCMSYSFAVFRLHLHCIGQEIKGCLRSTSMTPDQKAEVTEQCRTLLHRLRECLQETGIILGPGLLFTYGYTAALFCAAIIYCLLPNVTPVNQTFFLGSGCMHFGSLLLPTALAHCFADDASTSQFVLASYFFAVSLLVNTLEREDYLFSINDYFNVNLRTFTSIIGAALMYTVFLVQTSRPPVEGSGQH